MKLKSIQALVSKYRGIIAYGIFGVLTTLVNYAVYLAGIHIFTGRAAAAAAAAAAWFVSVLFAYFTNRKWVFQSRVTGFAAKLRECAAFFGSRLATGFLDVAIMYLAVDVMRFDGGIVKLASNVVVIVLNYVLSKLVVFKK